MIKDYEKTRRFCSSRKESQLEQGQSRERGIVGKQNIERGRRVGRDDDDEG